MSFSEEAFYRIFKRTAILVDLRGAKTAHEINRRIYEATRKFNPKITTGWRTVFERILPSFGKQCIDHAISNPYGRVALTLKYGPKRAERIIERRALEYLEYLREKAKRKRKRRKKNEMDQ